MKAPWSRVCISEILCVLLFLFVFRRKHGCAVRAFRRADLHVIHQAVRAGFRGRSRLFSPQNFRYYCGFRQFFLAEVLLKTVKYAILFYTFPRYKQRSRYFKEMHAWRIRSGFFCGSLCLLPSAAGSQRWGTLAWYTENSKTPAC